jgi:hypothetical protein
MTGSGSIFRMRRRVTHQAAGAALVEAAEGGIDGIVVMDFKL